MSIQEWYKLLIYIKKMFFGGNFFKEFDVDLKVFYHLHITLFVVIQSNLLFSKFSLLVKFIVKKKRRILIRNQTLFS